MKKHRLAAAAAVICLLLTGCLDLSLSEPDIMSPPMASGSQAEIQKLIKKSAGSNYEMVYPLNGDHKSSVVFSDLDGDKQDEAVAMYTSDKESVKIIVAEKETGTYKKLCEGTIHSKQLDRIDFADFTGDGNKDVIISYPGSASHLKSISILSSSGADQYDMLNACATYMLNDFNGDKKDDLLTLALSDGENLPTARLFTTNDNNEFEEQSVCEISSDVNEYISLTYGKVYENVSGAVIDAKDFSGKYSTQLICYDENSGSIINPLYVNNDYEKTKRVSQIASADIDKDGLIEIPLCSPMEASSREERSSICDRIDWSNYDYTQLSLSVKQSAILCDKLGFMLNLSKEHADIVTARYIGDDTMSIFLWEYKQGEPSRTTKLATIKRYDRAEYDPDAVFEAKLGENNSYVYTYIIDTAEGFYGYTDDEIVNNFVLLENPLTD